MPSNTVALCSQLFITITRLFSFGTPPNPSCGRSLSAEGTLNGGSFTGRAGDYARGIYNSNSNTKLEAESASALGENSSITNYGLYNGAEAELRGGSFTGHEGTYTHGIHNEEGLLEAESVAALGEDISE